VKCIKTEIRRMQHIIIDGKMKEIEPKADGAMVRIKINALLTYIELKKLKSEVKHKIRCRD